MTAIGWPARLASPTEWSVSTPQSCSRTCVEHETKADTSGCSPTSLLPSKDTRSPWERALPTSLAASCVCGPGLTDVTRNLVKMKRSLGEHSHRGFYRPTSLSWGRWTRSQLMWICTLVLASVCTEAQSSSWPSGNPKPPCGVGNKRREGNPSKAEQKTGACLLTWKSCVRPHAGPSSALFSCPQPSIEQFICQPLRTRDTQIFLSHCNMLSNDISSQTPS